MQRRGFLATLAGGTLLLSGCSSQETSDEDPPTETTNTPTDAEGTDDTGTPILADSTVVDFETVPLTATVVDGFVRTADGLTMTLEFAEPATADSPAVLAATVRNHYSSARTVDSDRIPVLEDPSLSRPDEDAVLYLAPVDDHPLAETTPGYERDADGRWRLEAAPDDWFPETVTLEAEERVVGEYYLLGHHAADEPPIEAGRFRFGGREHSVTVVVWSTDEPGPDGDSRFAGADPPSLPVEGDARWYHDATPATETFLEPDVESVAAPARIEFDLVNHGREPLSGNHLYWRLYKLADGDWFPIAPWVWPMPSSILEPGAVHERTLALFAGEPVQRDGERTVGHLGGGRYAYTGGFRTDDEAHAALFDLEAPDLAVEPETDATIEDDGDAVVVRLPNAEEAYQPATFALSRVDSTAATAVDERLIPEQLYRGPFRCYRNSLPLFEAGVDAIRVETARSTALAPFDYEADVTRTVAFQGSVYEATATLET